MCHLSSVWHSFNTYGAAFEWKCHKIRQYFQRRVKKNLWKCCIFARNKGGLAVMEGWFLGKGSYSSILPWKLKLLSESHVLHWGAGDIYFRFWQASSHLEHLSWNTNSHPLVTAQGEKWRQWCSASIDILHHLPALCPATSSKALSGRSLRTQHLQGCSTKQLENAHQLAKGRN